VDLDEAAGKTHKCGPEHTTRGGMCNWDRHGQVHASKITLSGASHCSGREHVQKGTCNSRNACTWRCHNWDCHRWVCASKINLSGAGSCSRRRHAQGGHAQQCKCTLSRCLVILHRSIFSMKIQLLQFFVSVPHPLC
jgi:hypothetical protein